jgi:hypothetical protein
MFGFAAFSDGGFSSQTTSDASFDINSLEE